MKPWTSWLARLGLAGSCLFVTACGGSDVPDPDSDSKAATSSAAGAVPDAPPAVAQREEPAPAAAAPAATAPAEATASAKGDDAAPAATSPEAPAGKSESSSATSEMLALAAAPAPSAEKPAEGGDQANAPGGAAPGSGYQGSSGSGMPAGYSGASSSGMPAGYPGGSGTGSPGGYNESARTGGMPAGYPGAGGPGGGPGGGGGAPGLPGGGGGGENAGPADFNTPESAVMTFLAALRAKDSERLAEATARRAPTESSPHYQKTFTAIVEQSLAPEDIDELAKKFEGMAIVGQNQAKSSGRLGIILGKAASDGGSLTRTVTVRREKSGWKVCDISGQREFENPVNNRAIRRGNGRR